MAKFKITAEQRKSLREARKLIEDVAKSDGNEAETRRRIERIFDSIMGYDVFKHITREHAISGTGATEHCDFAIQIEHGETAKPEIMVELKRVNIDLSSKHLKQVATYSINLGVEWLILTNGKEWKLYHVTFGQPPVTKLVSSWNLMNDDLSALREKFDVISYRNVKKGGLNELWQKANVLTQKNILSVLLSEDSIKIIRRELKKSTGVYVTPEEIIGAIRRLLNEGALSELEDIKISFSTKKKLRKKRKKVEPKDEAIVPEMHPAAVEENKDNTLTEPQDFKVP